MLRIGRAAAWTAMVLVAAICMKAESGQGTAKEPPARDPITLCKNSLLINRDAIRTIKCRFLLSTDPKEMKLMEKMPELGKPVADREITYWDNGKSVRISVKGLKHPQQREMAWHNGEFKAYVARTDKKEIPSAIISKKLNQKMIGPYTPWTHCLLGFPEKLPATFSRKALEQTSQFEEIDNKKMLVIKSKYEDGMSETAWFDEKLDYAPTKTILERETKSTEKIGGTTLVKENTKFLMLKDGIMFPAKSRSRPTINGNPLPETVFKVLEIQVNEIIPENAFVIEFPEKARITNWDTKEVINPGGEDDK